MCVCIRIIIWSFGGSFAHPIQHNGQLIVLAQEPKVPQFTHIAECEEVRGCIVYIYVAQQKCAGNISFNEV